MHVYVRYTHGVEWYLVFKNKLCHFQHTDKPRGYYSNWGKPGTEGKLLCTSYGILKIHRNRRQDEDP